MNVLKGKVALVTGGSGSIGGAIAERLALEGATVVVSYVGFEEGAERTLDAVRKAGADGMTLALDQRDPESIESAIRQVVDQYSRLDILVTTQPGISAFHFRTWMRSHQISGTRCLKQTFGDLSCWRVRHHRR